jgi:hypothetical protein
MEGPSTGRKRQRVGGKAKKGALVSHQIGCSSAAEDEQQRQSTAADEMKQREQGGVEENGWNGNEEGNLFSINPARWSVA